MIVSLVLNPVLSFLLGDSVATSTVVVGVHTSCVGFNVASVAVPESVQDAVRKLYEVTDNLIKQLPPEDAERVTRFLRDFTHEVTAKTPNRTWCEINGQGLVEAAKPLDAPVANAVRKVLEALD